MNTLLRTLVTTLCILIASSPLCAEKDEDKPLNPEQRTALFDRLQQIQRGIHSFRADFVEQRRIPSLKTPLRFEGEVFYHKSGLFFMKYEKPVNHILKVEGNEALFYVEGSGTADILDLSTVKGIPGHADILALNPDKFKGKVWRVTKGYRLEETDGNGTNVQQKGRRLVVFIDSETFLIRQIQMEDESGDITELDFLHIEINSPLPSSVMQFELPKGTKINRLSQQ